MPGTSAPGGVHGWDLKRKLVSPRGQLSRRYHAQSRCERPHWVIPLVQNLGVKAHHHAHNLSRGYVFSDGGMMVRARALGYTVGEVPISHIFCGSPIWGEQLGCRRGCPICEGSLEPLYHSVDEYPP